MGRTYLKYSAVLIGLYIGAVHASGMGSLFTQGASGAAKVVKTFQGR